MKKMAYRQVASWIFLSEYNNFEVGKTTYDTIMKGAFLASRRNCTDLKY